MTTCMQIRESIDRREPGEKEPPEITRHVATCRECAEYRAAADATASLLRELKTCLATSAGTDRAFEAFSARLRQSRRQAFFAIAGGTVAALAAVAIAARGDLTAVGALLFLLFIALCAFYVWWSSRDRTRWNPMGRTVDNFFGDWKAVLARRIRLTTIIASVVAAEIAIGGLLLLLRDPGLQGDGAPIFLGLGLVAGVGVLYTFLLELPELKKELALAEEGAGG